MKPTAEERFWSKIRKDASGCWIWLGTVGGRSTYGVFTLNGQRVLTHRYSFYLAHGCWPKLQCLHSCDVPRCCNPDHLRDGSISDNMSDKVKRNRQAKGERNGMSRLTVEMVQAIKRRLKASNGKDMRGIAEEFGVSHNTVWYIKKGRTWAWV